MRICLDCDQGGHAVEMMQIAENLRGYDIFVVYPSNGKSDIMKKENYRYYPVVIHQGPKSQFGFFVTSILELLRGMLSLGECARIIKKEKPDIIISTRSILTLELTMLCKMQGAKIIFIESLTRVNSKSGTGRIVYRYADLFLVQWQSMLKVYPKAKYWGKVV